MAIALIVCVRNFTPEPIARHVWINKLERNTKLHVIIYVYFKLSDTNACSVLPCQNGGTCSNTNTGSSYACACPQGFTGNNCQTCKILIFF